MRTSLIALVFLVVAPLSASADSLHDCSKTPSVTINEGDGHYKFVGACAKIVINGGDNRAEIESVKQLTINGTDNVIVVEVADKIMLTGTGNKVSYRKGLSSAKPRISSVGVDNQISQLK